MEVGRCGVMEPLHGEAQVLIDGPPDAVYALIADVTRTPEWSPEVVSCRWIGPTPDLVPRARFRGTSRSRWLRWTRTCEVVSAVPGKEFAFRTVPDLINRDSTTWRYTIEPQRGGTLLVESFEIHQLPGLLVRVASRLLGDRPADITPHLRISLAHIKALVEHGDARA